MNEEAGFIAALLAEPNDVTTLLVYADWLDERDDPRAEYMRLLAANRPNQRRLAQLRRTLDEAWVHLIDYRHWQVGHRARIMDGAFRNSEGDVISVSEDRRQVTVRLFFWGRPVDVELELSLAVELLPTE